MMKRLILRGEENWVWVLTPAGRVPLFEFKFFYHPDLGEIHCDQIGVALDCAIDLNRITSEQGWPGWHYKTSDAPGEGTKYELRFRRGTPHSGAAA